MLLLHPTNHTLSRKTFARGTGVRATVEMTLNILRWQRSLPATDYIPLVRCRVFREEAPLTQLIISLSVCEDDRIPSYSMYYFLFASIIL
jgi:hypothetical protein